MGVHDTDGTRGPARGHGQVQARGSDREEQPRFSASQGWCWIILSASHAIVWLHLGPTNGLRMLGDTVGSIGWGGWAHLPGFQQKLTLEEFLHLSGLLLLFFF